MVNLNGARASHGDIYTKNKFTHTEKTYSKDTWKLFFIEKGHKIYCKNCNKYILKLYKPHGVIQILCPYCNIMNEIKLEKQNVICHAKYKYKIKQHEIKNIKKNNIENVHYFNCLKCDNLLMRYKMKKGKIEVRCIKCNTINGVKMDKNEKGYIIHKRYYKKSDY